MSELEEYPTFVFKFIISEMNRRIAVILTILCIVSVQGFAQLEAKFSHREGGVVCYTGDATRNTTITFKNSSTTGEYWYIWQYGDGSVDSTNITKSVTVNGSHEYRTDGVYTVQLYVLDPTALHDSIKNARVQTIEYISTSGGSVSLTVYYTASDNTKRQATVTVPAEKFAKEVKRDYIEVYSPYVSSPNFTYEVDDPSTTDNASAIESFIYNFSVNTEDFKPHKEDVWIYYWTISEAKNTIEQFSGEVTDYRYTFPHENFDPGYTVSLQIALDSSKFDAADIEYYGLESCVASQSQVIQVTDYFFTDSTRKEVDFDDREALIPNVFTPGGNDENDVFYFNTNGIDDFSIWIYNNNGTLVYSQSAKTITWTGHDNSGHNCPSGTYYYVVKSTNADKRHNTAGHIHLFRQN